jgi:crotonobetainyl-CoA:carnitine CoA-transferase CaiB-like acyl-CoA transferase
MSEPESEPPAGEQNRHATPVRAADCEEILLAGKVPCARYREVAEIFDDPQLTHRGAFTRARDWVAPKERGLPPRRRLCGALAVDRIGRIGLHQVITGLKRQDIVCAVGMQEALGVAD